MGNRIPTVRVGRRRWRGIQEFYQAVRPGQPVAILGSSGFLEIAVNGGNAARVLRLEIGTPVRAG
ncbi:MAG: SAM-dependent chlorinase/fluorinase [Verrucomicrobia bacterium]|nr:SAM-dependent chlorinase/fluorinase [Verrucomicrobiota bacterium]